MKSPYRIVLVFGSIALAINLAVGFSVYHRQVGATGEDDSVRVFDQLGSVTRIVRSSYVDESKISYDQLMQSAIRGMMSELDPFSGYFPPIDNKEVEEQTQGEFGGIGVVIGLENDQVVVLEPIEGSPGERAGLQTGDRFIEVDRVPLGKTTTEAVARKIKGEPGTSVEVTILRPSTKEVLHIMLVRDIIQVPSVTDIAMVSPEVGYCRLVQFTEKCPDELERAMLELREQNMQALILDLRYNPGGLLQAAQLICSYFIDTNELVVFTEGRTPDQRQSFYSLPTTKFDIPVIVLINGMSASASEIVAGCLKDTGRGLLVGEKSFGKGTVQTPFQLPDGGSIHLTTARYYTPSKQVIHEHGVLPDVVISVEGNADHVPFRKPKDGSEIEIKDVQLLKALEVMKDWRRGVRPVMTEPVDDAADEAAEAELEEIDDADPGS